MAARWLNLFFRFSGFVFGLKQKIVKSDNLLKVLPQALFLLLLEFGFAIISIPMYLMVSPEKVQETGVVFPKNFKVKEKINTYTVRRKISLVTTSAAGLIFFIKVIFVGIVSLYLLGAQQLLASTQNWDFTSSSNYSVSSSSLEFVGGAARLKDLGSTVSGTTTNSDLSSNSNGWTYADWLNNASVAGSYQASGGNPGGYINIAMTPAKNKTTAGFWRQQFTTTVNSPDTAVLTFDWSSVAFSVPAPLTSYKLYAFIDTGTGNPVLGTEVWSSPEITGLTSWATVASINIASKVQTAGTYNLKIAAYSITPGTTGTYSTTIGLDNILVSWSKVTHLYDTSKPSVTPSSSLTMAKTVSWNSFSETAVKNGGEIYYQLSDDNGSTWKYWAGSNWAVAGSSNYNIASDINTYISSFATSSNQIKFKAFLSSNGTQQVSLDNVSIGYTENLPTSVVNLLPVQNSQNGYVFVNYNLVDAENDPASLVTYEYSLTGAFAGEQVTMMASSTDPSHNGISNLSTSAAGVSHTFVWDAKSQLGAVSTTVYIRLRANDGIQSGVYASSTAVVLDYVNPVVTSVSATQPLNTTTVAISYALSDNTADNLFVDFQISNDGGSTWTVPVSSASGDVNTGVTTGISKSIYWNAGVNYNGHDQNNLQVRVRAKDKWQNIDGYVTSTNFSVDTLAPAVLETVDLKAQPNAGDTTVLVGGSFTENNPSTNTFYAAVNGGAYDGGTVGMIDTARPSHQSTNVSTTLKGNNYISKVKIVHTDKYGQSFDNENISPSSTFKYVKPYTPAAPTLSNPITTHLDLLVNKNINEVDNLEYAIYESSTSKYVQNDGSLGVVAVWKTTADWGTKTVTGLTSPVSQYIFKVKSRNIADSSNATSSESSFSAPSQIPNTAPDISLDNYSQTSDGSDYVVINYFGTDGQGDISSVPVYQYSVNNVNWFSMTQKNGVGSSGTSSLVFLPTGSNYNFAWDSGVDLPNIETSTVRVRFKPNDSIVDGSVITSNMFTIDNKAPVISDITAQQGAGTKTITFNYDLTDSNNSFVNIEISSDGGATWQVSTSTLSGAVGSGVVPGANKTVTWNAGSDFANQFNSNMIVRIRARDSFGNVGNYISSSAFTVDTHAPVISNISATQQNGSGNFTFNYDASEDIGNVFVVLSISSDGGLTWVVPTSSATGDFGSVAVGANKTINWNGLVNFVNQEKQNMQIKIFAYDQYTNSSYLTSSNFNLDTYAPRISSITAIQPLGGTVVNFGYTLSDQNNSLVQMDISSDGGLTWNVASSSITGDVGNVNSGEKSVVWNAKADFSGNQTASMKVRFRALDIFGNQSGNSVSANFNLDTLSPAVLVTADLKAQPLAGDSSILIGGSFTEVNPDANIFSAVVDGGDYSAGVAGTSNTASPADLSTSIGVTLKGNDYISKVKIVHTDDYGQVTSNENVSLNNAFKYVKPYTPVAPTVDNPTVGTVDVLVNKNPNEVNGLEYAIFETSQNKYVQANGTLGNDPVWQPLGVLLGQWGEFLSESGKVRVVGLTYDSYLYQFKVKSRNSSDVLHLSSSESALSAGASSQNQAPLVVINSVSQTNNGGKYVVINYTGSDLESESSSLIKYEYSTDNSIWHQMTEKAGVGSEGVSGLNFSNTGTAHTFVWDVGVDLPSTEDNTVYVRLQANDGNSDGNIAIDSPFTIDTKNPTISSLTALQVLGLHNVSIGYNLTDLNNSQVSLLISSDGGVTWGVASSTVSGAVGANIIPGDNKTITWNALADFPNQESNSVRIKLQATDSFGNQSSFVQSSNFIVDTKVPLVNNVVAVQNNGNNFVTVSYDLSDTSTSTVVLEASLDSGLTWSVAVASVSGDVGSGVVSGNGKVINWNAGLDFPNQQLNTMKVRVKAVDVYNNNGDFAQSLDFSIDTKAPLLTFVSGAQVVGTDNFNFSYDLFDSANVVIALDISSDGGVSWSVPTSTLSGAIGAGVSPGFGKVISWNGGVDYANHQSSNLKIRIRGTDIFNNTSINFESAIFNLDTAGPIVANQANLVLQPNAGESAVLISGSFEESNPTFNDFSLAINGGEYVSSTAGQSGTSLPASQSTSLGVSLTGADYISKVKVTESDYYGHVTVNENTSPNILYKFVKPYKPQSPIVNNAQNTSVDLTIVPHENESANVEYAILENSTNKYVQTDGTLATTSVWKKIGTASGQWGNESGVVGKVVVRGLSSPVANYNFKVKSRNPFDSAHSSSSESDFSNISSIANSSPTVSINSAAQVVGTSYVAINYVGTDAQNDTNNLTNFEFSTNTIDWFVMTEKNSVGSNGTSNLLFSSAGTSYLFAWDVAADLPNTEMSLVYVRVGSNDGLTNSNLAVSSAFAVDVLGPVISNLSVSQSPGTNNIVLNYDLSDNSVSGNNIQLLISSNSGLSWTVVTSSVSGDVGSGVSAGTNKNITWNAGVDFPNQENNLMQVKMRALDRFGNYGSYFQSGNFSVDTKAPIVDNVSAVQSIGSTDVVINYELSDFTVGGHFVDLLISDNGGITWSVVSTSLSGNIGAGQNNGSKTVVWNAGVDFVNQNKTTMKVKVRARDYYGNQGDFTQSNNFTLDTAGPEVSTVGAVQSSTSTLVNINYNISDTASGSVKIDLDLSDDGGVTWNVSTTSLSGDVGLGQSVGLNTATWNVGVDYPGQENINMRVRVRATDSYGNIGTYFSSNNFVIDTKGPSGLITFNKISNTSSTVVLSWSNTVSDLHFDHYEIWHGTNQNDVNNRTGSAQKWSVLNDSSLSNILTAATIMDIATTTVDYYAKIWAVDGYGFETTLSAIKLFETPSVLPSPIITPVTTVSVGSGFVAPSARQINKPVLNSIISLTNNTVISVSGLADSRTRIDLYDNGVFVSRLSSATDNDGNFSQNFTFGPGSHSLAVRASDFDNNFSAFSDNVDVTIITTIPALPIIISPLNNSNITQSAPTVSGVAQPSTNLEVVLDNREIFNVPVDANGSWNFVLPSTNVLGNGKHNFNFKVVDKAGNESGVTSLVINKISPPASLTNQPLVPVTAQVPELVSPASIIRINTEATEVPGLLTPTIGNVIVPTNLITTQIANTQINDIINFSGLALPNQDVVVYVHSEQGLIYRVKADDKGRWQVNHSQNEVELTPGDHTIFAVTLDAGAKVKSRPSAVTIFTVKRNLLVTVFKHLNIQTTVVSLGVLFITIIWLYRINKKQLVT